MNNSTNTVHQFSISDIDGENIEMSDYAGKVLLLVNVASECGLTPQYNGLQAIQEKYDGRFTVIGLPCNQFGAQEPGTEAEIKTFCSTTYQANFPLTSKIEVNGENRHPLYNYLAGENAKFPGDITWNFEKFLIAKDGSVANRFGPRVEPESDELIQAIDEALAH